MKFLTYKEIKKLQELVENSLYIQDREMRSILLRNCGLEKYCSIVNLDGSSRNFVLKLFDNFSKNDIAFGNSQKSDLIFFIEYLRDNDEKLGRDDFIKYILNKWQQKQSYSFQKPKIEKINNLLIQGREAPIYKSVQQSIKKIDRSIIINYDLEKLVATLRQQVGYEGAFTFSISGDSRILDSYIIERIRKALKGKTGRDNDLLQIRLYQENSITSRDIERKFLNAYQFEYFTDLFSRYVSDTVLIIWNYDIPQKNFKPLAQEFWEIVSPSIYPYVKNMSRCFIIIWANLGKRSLTGFTVLPTPKEFDLQDLIPWFRSQLKILEVEDKIIDYYLKRLESQNGHLIGTYQEIDQIIKELQGGSQIYG